MPERTAAICTASDLHVSFVGANAGAGEFVAFVVLTNDARTDCEFGARVRVEAAFTSTVRQIGVTDNTSQRLTPGGAADIELRGQAKDYDAPRDQCAASDWSTPTAWQLAWGDQMLSVANFDKSSPDSKSLSACKGRFRIVTTVAAWTQ